MLFRLQVRSDFVLLVNLVNYTNPSGLCAECNGTFEPNKSGSADDLVPVCCDELPFTSENCDNTGEAKCDTRFRWRLRPFGSSLETRPASIAKCSSHHSSIQLHTLQTYLTPDMCPFSEISVDIRSRPNRLSGGNS